MFSVIPYEFFTSKPKSPLNIIGNVKVGDVVSIYDEGVLRYSMVKIEKIQGDKYFFKYKGVLTFVEPTLGSGIIIKRKNIDTNQYRDIHVTWES